MSTGVNLLLISGDLSILGSRKTHEDLSRILSSYGKAGISVFVTPGNHDLNNPQASRFTLTGTDDVDTVGAVEFAKIYGDFGFDESLISDEGEPFLSCPIGRE